MTSEKDLMLPALEALNASLLGELTTTELRLKIKSRVPLSEEDRKPLKNRNDQRIDQIIRNLKSHKKTPGNPVFEGLIAEVPRGFRITEAGRRAVERNK